MSGVFVAFVVVYQISSFYVKLVGSAKLLCTGYVHIIHKLRRCYGDHPCSTFLVDNPDCNDHFKLCHAEQVSRVLCKFWWHIYDIIQPNTAELSSKRYMSKASAFAQVLNGFANPD